MSLSAKPAARNRFAIASEAVVMLPTESVVLISMSSWKIARDSALGDSAVVCEWATVAHNSAVATDPSGRRSICF
jgi:hypothetical protein